MPRIHRGEGWELGLRATVRASTASGWTVREHRGKVRLLVRSPGMPMRTVGLPFDWSRHQVAAIVARVRNIYLLTLQEDDLKEAAAKADGKVSTRSRNWSEVLENFRRQKLEHGGAIKPVTWSGCYAPVLTLAVELLQNQRGPTNSADLFDACLRGWKPGSRTRQLRAQSLAQFLQHCVTREHFPKTWQPPADLRPHIGVAAAEVAPGYRKGHPFTDLEILCLIDSLPANEAGARWADALRLMAELGLRPVELQHLTVRIEPRSGEAQWWCQYRKRSGGGMTNPRWIYPLPPIDWDGVEVRWNLLSRWQTRLLTLPHLGGTSGVASTVGHYLRGQEGWRLLRQRLAARNERAVPYSFRHSYSLRAHHRGIDAGSVALSMGHSFECHCRSYPWASDSGAAAAFKRARVPGEQAPGTSQRAGDALR